MTDRELLEYAAKACGIDGAYGVASDDYYYDGNVEGILTILPDGQSYVWNPITDDGDAFRLMVKLSLLIAPIPYQPGINAYGAVGVSWPGQRFDLDYERFTDDPLAATRIAIVRAAAEIGRSKT